MSEYGWYRFAADSCVWFFRIREILLPGVHRVGFETEKGEKMKKRFGSLSETEQEKIENKYHQMNPADFDDMMSEAEIASTTSIRLPGKIVEALKIVAKLEGERKYQNMVRKWITERLRHEAKIALRLSEMPIKEVVAVSEAQV